MREEDMTMLSIAMIGKGDFRILMPNETYYGWYNNGNADDMDEDEKLYDYDDDDEYA